MFPVIWLVLSFSSAVVMCQFSIQASFSSWSWTRCNNVRQAPHADSVLCRRTRMWKTRYDITFGSPFLSERKPFSEARRLPHQLISAQVCSPELGHISTPARIPAERNGIVIIVLDSSGVSSKSGVENGHWCSSHQKRRSPQNLLLQGKKGWVEVTVGHLNDKR